MAYRHPLPEYGSGGSLYRTGGGSSPAVEPYGLSRARMASPADYSRLAERPDGNSTLRYARDDMHASAPLASAGGAPGGGSAGGSQDRYLRLLERDVETLRHELRIAREKAENPELLRELREAQEAMRAGQRRLHEMERQLALAQEAERTHAAAQEAADALRDECRQQQLALSQLERDAAHGSDALRTAEHREHALQEQLQRVREELQHEQQRALEQQQQHTQQLRQAQHEREAAALEHSRAVSQAQLEQGSTRNELRMREQELRAREQTVEALTARLKKETDRSAEAQAAHERLLADLRSSKSEVEASLRSALQESQNRASQLGMKEELIALLEDENKHKQARMDESEKAFGALRSELLQTQERITDLTGERTTLEHRVSELESQLQTSDTLRKEGEAREEKLRATYTEVADALGATGAQRQTNTVVTRAREIMAELDRVTSELRALQREHEVTAHEGSSRSLRVEQLQREIERAGVEHKRLEGEAGSLREDLLTRTRELKDLTLAHEQLHRELRGVEERAGRYDDVLLQKDRYIEDLTRQIDDLNSQGANQADELRNTLSRAEGERLRELAQLRADLARAQEEHRTDRQYAEMCRRLSRLLRVEPDTTATVHSERLYAAVEQLAEKAREAERLAAAAAQAPPPRTPWTDPSALYPQRHPEPHHRQDEELLTLRVAHESFVREVGRAVHSDNIHSHEAVLQAVRAYVRKHHSKSSEDAAGARRSRKNGDTPSSGRNAHDETDYQRIKKRLGTALKTIESQDMWIDVLNRKVESLGGSTSGQGMQQDMQRMEQEVAHLKRQLSLKDSGLGRPDSAMPVYHNFFAGAGGSTGGAAPAYPGTPTVGPSDILAFKSTIADLEARLQKHIEFRERVLEVLGLKVISASDDEILRHIREAVTAARGLAYGGSPGPTTIAATMRRSHSPLPYSSSLGGSLGAPNVSASLSAQHLGPGLGPHHASASQSRSGTLGRY